MKALSTEHLAKIRWHCRRGMLELDIILQKFVDLHYSKLAAAEQKSFEKLLECHDQELYAWLIKRKQPNDDFAEIVKEILKMN